MDKSWKGTSTSTCVLLQQRCFIPCKGKLWFYINAPFRRGLVDKHSFSMRKAMADTGMLLNRQSEENLPCYCLYLPVMEITMS